MTTVSSKKKSIDFCNTLLQRALEESRNSIAIRQFILTRENVSRFYHWMPAKKKLTKNKFIVHDLGLLYLNNLSLPMRCQSN